MEDNVILSSVKIADRIKKIQIQANNIARKQKPGQFVIVRVDDSGERIPLTIVDADPQTGWINLVVQDVGKSSHTICTLEPGQKMHDMVGPLGNPSHITNFGRALVVGGGVGTAVSYPVAKALKAAGNHVTTIFGARSKELVILEDEMREVSDECYVTTDDGSYGFHGFVTQQLQKLLDAGERFDYAIAIGPLPMMRAISEVTRPYGIPTTVSLNTIMVDGTGMCGGCRVKVGNETRFTCVDGPEFDGHLVDFDMVINRNKAYIHEEQCALDAKVEEIKAETPKHKLPARRCRNGTSQKESALLMK